jgi:hypothetical protein
MEVGLMNMATSFIHVLGPHLAATIYCRLDFQIKKFDFTPSSPSYGGKSNLGWSVILLRRMASLVDPRRPPPRDTVNYQTIHTVNSHLAIRSGHAPRLVELNRPGHLPGSLFGRQYKTVTVSHTEYMGVHIVSMRRKPCTRQWKRPD